MPYHPGRSYSEMPKVPAGGDKQVHDGVRREFAVLGLDAGNHSFAAEVSAERLESAVGSARRSRSQIDSATEYPLHEAARDAAAPSQDV